MSDLGQHMLFAEFDAFVFAHLWRWGPDQLRGMPLSVRWRYAKAASAVLKKRAEAQQDK